MKNKPVIIFYDIETSLMKVRTFTLYPKSIPYYSIDQDWFMISAAWKTLGSKTVQATSINDFKRKGPDDDYGVVKTLRDALEKADVIISHNGNKFDLKKLNSRLIYHKLKPLPPIPQIDTLKECKRVATFTSHRLDFLGAVLTGSGKLQTDSDLWKDATDGDRKAVTKMVKYNKEDVRVLEAVYKKLSPYIKIPTHMGAMMGKDRHKSCPNCGHEKFISRHDKYSYSATGLRRKQRQCAKCYKYSTIPDPVPNMPPRGRKGN